jgi:hypothetical protein
MAIVKPAMTKKNSTALEPDGKTVWPLKLRNISRWKKHTMTVKKNRQNSIVITLELPGFFKVADCKVTDEIPPLFLPIETHNTIEFSPVKAHFYHFGIHKSVWHVVRGTGSLDLSREPVLFP